MVLLCDELLVDWVEARNLRVGAAKDERKVED
jgi:hypothetical protein